MKSGVRYLLAARRFEIVELERLWHTSELVGIVGRLTHALQRERGMSNVFLASRGARFGDLRLQQVVECDLLQADVVAAFEQVDEHPERSRNGARLFNRIAEVMHGLESLTQLRADVADLAIAPRAATSAYARLIGSLLGVIFEAVDSAGDPDVSRSLVALFHYMQAKEFAGLERALGAAVFASGGVDAETQREWRDLIDQQQHLWQLFADYADPEVVAADHASQDPDLTARIETLRRMGWTAGQAAPDAELVAQWYDCMTGRIDAMRSIEDVMATGLRRLCERKIAETRSLLRDESALLASAAAAGSGDPPPSPGLGPGLQRSVMDMVQEQSRRLHAMSDELEAVRATLNERKVIERAKGLLMAHRQLTEDEAYKLMRQMSMNQKRRLVDVAEGVLAMADMLPGRSR